MPYPHREPSVDELEQAAAEALTHPPDAAFSDPRWYTSHAPVLTKARNSDDLYSEINYEVGLQALVTRAGERDEDVVETAIRHWAMGYIDQVFVRVRDEDGQFTPAWREAVAIALYLRDVSPILDEDELSTREVQQWDDAFEEEWSWAVCAWPLDEPDEQALRIATYEAMFATAETSRTPTSSDIAETYAVVRDQFYGERAQEHLTAQIPGQGALTW